METLAVNLKLKTLTCHDEADGPGNAEPYLWTVFFKVDGDTTRVTDALTLSGTGTVFTNSGSHGNLGRKDVEDGDVLNVPSRIGEWPTILKPIPVPPSLASLFPKGIGGMMGVVCILMEEDNVTDDGADAGHRKLNEEVKNAINAIIPTISASNQDIDDEIAAMEDKIKNAITSAIRSQQNWLEDFWSWTNPDDTIGTKTFTFSHNSLESNLTTPQDFSQRWKNEGDWELKGQVTAKIYIPPVPTPAPCRSISRTLEQLKEAKRQLQQELHSASPAQKAAILKEIKELNEEITKKSKELADCLRQNP